MGRHDRVNICWHIYVNICWHIYVHFLLYIYIYAILCVYIYINQTYMYYSLYKYTIYYTKLINDIYILYVVPEDLRSLCMAMICSTGSTVSKDTKPKPRERPVPRSLMTWATQGNFLEKNVEKTWNNGNFHGKTCGKRVELEKYWVYMVYKHI